MLSAVLASDSPWICLIEVPLPSPLCLREREREQECVRVSV